MRGFRRTLYLPFFDKVVSLVKITLRGGVLQIVSHLHFSFSLDFSLGCSSTVIAYRVACTYLRDPIDSLVTPIKNVLFAASQPLSTQGVCGGGGGSRTRVLNPSTHSELQPSPQNRCSTGIFIVSLKSHRHPEHRSHRPDSYQSCHQSSQRASHSICHPTTAGSSGPCLL